MHSQLFNGFIIDYSILSEYKDSKKYCGNPPNFQKDMEDFAKLIIGKYVEHSFWVGDIVPCGTEEVKSLKHRFPVSVWNLSPSEGYRIYYFVDNKRFIFAHVYIKAKNNILNETNHFKEVFKGRFL